VLTYRYSIEAPRSLGLGVARDGEGLIDYNCLYVYLIYQRKKLETVLKSNIQVRLIKFLYIYTKENHVVIQNLFFQSYWKKLKVRKVPFTLD
jgi:hypothetical protein